MEGIEELLVSPERLRAVTKVLFDEVDKDKSGQIELPELRVAMHQIAYEANRPVPSEEDVIGVLQALDKDGSGSLNVEEFQVLITEVVKALLRP